jgi:uncharacterized protein
MRSFFPDVNVWLALSYDGHQHHASAAAWFARLHSEPVYFCRFTQLGFLRLITHPSVMGDEVRDQTEAWSAYDQFLGDERVSFHPEPDHEQLESTWRRITSGKRPASKQWPDAYLTAFARAAGLTLITFDRALRQMNAGSVVILG